MREWLAASPWAWNAMTRLIAGNYTSRAAPEAAAAAAAAAAARPADDDPDSSRGTAARRVVARAARATFGFAPPARARRGFWAELERREYTPATRCSWRATAPSDPAAAAAAARDRALLATATRRLEREYAAFTLTERMPESLELVRDALCLGGRPSARLEEGFEDARRGNSSAARVGEAARALGSASAGAADADALAREFSALDVELYAFARGLLRARLSAKQTTGRSSRCEIAVSCRGAAGAEHPGAMACPDPAPSGE